MCCCLSIIERLNICKNFIISIYRHDKNQGSKNSVTLNVCTLSNFVTGFIRRSAEKTETRRKLLDCNKLTAVTTKGEIFFFSWRYNSHWGLYFTALWWALASSLAKFLDHTQRRTTFGRTPLDE